MKRALPLALCLALAPLAWAGDDDHQADKDQKALRDRILKRVSAQLDKEFARIRGEVKELLDKELGIKEEKGEEKKPEAKAPKKPENPHKDHAAKPPEEKGTEKPDSQEKKQGWLGIQLAQGDEPTIGGVFPDTPAEKAGLQEGDVVEKVNGKAVDSPQALIDAVQGAGPGTVLKLSVRRGEDKLEVKVKLAERPKEQDMPNPDPGDDDDENK